MACTVPYGFVNKNIPCDSRKPLGTAGLRGGVVFILFLIFISLVLWRPGSSVLASPVSYSLYGSSAWGWGFQPTDENMTIPGPDLTVVQGETVLLTLTAVIEPFLKVTVVHDFGVDYDGDCDPSRPPCQPSSGEPWFGFFGGGGSNPDTIAYTFKVNAPAPGTYTYYCYVHAATMLGRFIVEPGEPPVAGFNYTPASPSVGEPVIFDASKSSDLDGVIESYDWSFGDGGSDSGITVQHAYLNPGPYTATLTVRDNAGLTDTAFQSITVAGPGNSVPVANFTFTPSKPILGQRVDLDASSSRDPDEGDWVTSYSWDFGDGSNLADRTEPWASHFYRIFGILYVTLNVTDDHGALGQYVRRVEVLPVRNVALTSLVVTPSSVRLGAPVTVDVAVSNLGNVTEVFGIRLRWNSTGIISWSATLSAAEQFDRSYNWTPPGPGTYNISAKVLVSSDDQHAQDDEKTASLRVEVQDERAAGLPGVFYSYLGAVAVAATGGGLYFYRRRHVALGL